MHKFIIVRVLCVSFYAWEQRKLGDLAEIVRGASPRPIQNPKWFDDSSEIGWLRISDVTAQDGRIHRLEQHISVEGQEKTRVLTTPHLLLSIAATVGKPVINYISTGVHDGFLIFLKPRFELEFMFQWLENFRSSWQRYGQPGSQVNLNSGLVRKQTIYIPTREEQQKIAGFCEKLDNLITLQQRKIDTLKLLKKALLQQIIPENNHIIPRIRPIHFKEPWNQDKINNIFKVTRGQVLSATLVSEVKTDIKKYPVYSSQTKNNGLLGYFDKFLFEDAITWTTDGANAGTVNFRKGKFYSTNVNGVLISKDKYANQLIAEIINRIAWKYVSKVGNPKLMNNVMSDIKICVPLNYDEQNIMSLLLQNLDDFLNLNNQKIIQIKTVKKSLLRKMFI